MSKTNTPLTISHTILYAKGWYKRSNKRHSVNTHSICWEDIIKTLTADGFIVKNKYDCLRVLNHVIYNTSLIAQIDYLEFLDTISPSKCRIIGYNTIEDVSWFKKEELPNYSQEDAICFFFLKTLRHLPTEAWVLKAPKKSVLPFTRKRGRQKGWMLDIFGDCMLDYKKAVIKRKLFNAVSPLSLSQNTPII